MNRQEMFEPIMIEESIRDSREGYYATSKGAVATIGLWKIEDDYSLY